MNAALIQRINEYLAAGGLFNPESMEHDKVRSLLLDLRDALQKPVEASSDFASSTQLYKELHAVVLRYTAESDLTAYHAMGALEAVKFDLTDQLHKFHQS